ncbi:prepilin-type N-terminal cleavage/methylation domain-containing protein [bacterium]|nr:prepilin-type N-terminal cleavage/methylation domain-containing protein [bacterium]
MLFNNLKKLNRRGFTLVETIVGVAVFVIVANASYQAYISLFKIINQNQYKIAALNLANEQFEIIRNLPYSDVGVTGSIPNGKIPHTQTLVRSNITFTVTMTIRNIDLPFDGQIGSTTNDLSPADNKVVEVEVACSTCGNFTSITLTTNVAPKNLETASTNGALVIKVFDSNGVPVSDASVHVVNSQITPNIVIDDVTNVDGVLQIVDAPPGVDAYQITVTKNGYSTDKTYTPGANGNPTPTKPHATVILQQLTQVSFAIDRLSTLSFSSVKLDCTPVANINFNLKGGKTTGPSVYKYSKSLTTDSSGSYSSSTMEWDTYTVTGTDGSYDIIGINPLNPISLIANSTQSVQLVVSPRNEKSLLVTVKDSATQLPITDAVVRVTRNSYDTSKTTGRGSINQTDWSDGGAQDLYVDQQKYFSDDGNIETGSPNGEIKLRNVFGNYNSSGILESSTFDTGSPSNFYSLTWTPTDQPLSAGSDSVRFQFATNLNVSTTTTWDYKGPDGTTGTYYTNPNSTISNVHNGDRYARYKVYLASISSTSTPNISDISFTETTQCTPPGQVVFAGLSEGTYQVEVSKVGYNTSTTNVDVDTAFEEQEVLLSP